MEGIEQKRQADEMLTGSKIMRIFDNVGIWTFKTPAEAEETGNNSGMVMYHPNQFRQ